MQNQIFSHPFYQNNLHSLQQVQDMEDHFNNLLSLGQSQYTAAQTMVSSTNNTNQQAFHSSRMFVIGTLQTWGMKMGTLPFSRDNQTTLKCILQLINQRQRDIQYKMKIKEQINAVNFQKQKYQSLLKQTKNTLSSKDKLLGKYQNQCTELRKKIKLLENQTKKQKTDDQKIIFMLKSKNQQILHQIKKKQAQITKIKQQMKRSIVSKSSTVTPSNKNQSPLHSNSNTVKNSFELIQKIQRINNTVKQSKWKKNIPSTQRINVNQNYADNFQQEKWNFMVEKYEKQKKIFTNQNTLLRNKIFQIRQLLVNFAEWLQIELFGQTLQSTKKFLQKKFICNHNLTFSQNALIQDLEQIIKQAKEGIQQFQDRLQQTQLHVPSNKSIQSPLKSNRKVGFNNASSKSIPTQGNGMFKKKSVSIRDVGTPGKTNNVNQKSQKKINSGGKQKQSQKHIASRQRQKVQQKMQPISKMTTVKSPQIQKKMFGQSEYMNQAMPSQIRPTKSTYINQLQLSAFENDLLSDIHEHSGDDPDNSIISHISTSQLLREVQNGQKGKYDKWDILFHTEGDEEE